MKKVLLDENLPHELRYYIPGHDVRTARFERWDGIDNGNLLNLAVDDGFDVMVTMDARIPRDHNIVELDIGLILLTARSNRMQDLSPLIPELEFQVFDIKPGQVVQIPAIYQ